MTTFTDIPPEIIAIIISPDLIGYSTRRTFALTSKWACILCHPSDDEIEHPIFGFERYYCRLIDLAAREGHLEIMTYAMSTGDDLADVVYEAALGGQLHVLEKYVEVWTYELAHMAITEGHLNVLEHILEHGHPYRFEAFFEAARQGHFNIIQYICERNISACHPATRSHKILSPYIIHRIAESAVPRGHLHIIDWIFNNTSMFRFSVLYRDAIIFDQIIVVEWMIKHGAIMTSDWYKYAVSYERHDIQNLLISAGCPLS